VACYLVNVCHYSNNINKIHVQLAT